MKTIVGCAWALISILGAVGACSSSDATGAGGANGTGASAGKTSGSSGGSSTPGGSPGTTGGAPGVAGSAQGISGSTSSAGTLGVAGTTSGTAGAATSGGATSTGGSAAGGNLGTGGSTSSGGTVGTGGTSSGGGLGGSTNDLGTITGSPAIAQLLALTKNCTTANQIPNSHTYKLDDNSTTSICSLKGGAGNAGGAIFYTADMDIDCDGITTAHCPGTGADMDCCYQDQTSFHGPNSMSNQDGTSLASENTPYVVIPQDVKFPGLDMNNGGNIIAVIYNNQLEFGVFGDTGPKDIIGEASVRTANGLGIPSSPASGGVGGGVTYIVFVGTGSQPTDMENLSEVQTLGAKLTQSLISNNQ